MQDVPSFTSRFSCSICTGFSNIDFIVIILTLAHCNIFVCIFLYLRRASLVGFFATGYFFAFTFLFLLLSFFFLVLLAFTSFLASYFFFYLYYFFLFPYFLFFLFKLQIGFLYSSLILMYYLYNFVSLLYIRYEV